MRIFLLVIFILFLPRESAQSQVHRSDDQVKNNSKKSLKESADLNKVPFLGSMFSSDLIPSADIPISDTVIVEAGVTQQFEQGGAVTANGALSSIGSPEKPIKLKQVGAPQQENVAIKKSVYGRREVQP